MVEKIFYNSSLPRCGSTLAQNLLGQNPDFYVTPTSGLLELIFAARGNYTNSPEFKAQDKNLMEKSFINFCKGGMDSYANSITDKKYYVDKSRGWGIYYSFLNAIQPDPKIICMVRDIRDIITSLEKLYRKDHLIDSGIVNNSDMIGTTTAKRVDIWLRTQPVGLALDRLSDIFRFGIHSKIHFVKYEDLLSYPDETMKKLYDYLGTPYYQHNFQNIEQITVEDDDVYGIYGDHKIQTNLGTVNHQYEEILGKSVSNRIKEDYNWYFKNFGYV